MIKILGAIGGAIGGGAAGGKLGALAAIGVSVICPPAAAVVAPALIGNGILLGAGYGGVRGAEKPIEGIVGGVATTLPLPSVPRDSRG